MELLAEEVWQVSKRNSQYFRSYLRKTTGGGGALWQSVQRICLQIERWWVRAPRVRVSSFAISVTVLNQCKTYDYFHVEQAHRLDTWPALELDTEGLLSCSTNTASSRARHRGSLLRGLAQVASSRVQKRGPPLVLGTKGLLAGSAQWVSSQSAEKTFSQARHRGSALRLDAEGLLSVSAERHSSQSRQRWPSLRLDTEDIFSGSAEKDSSRFRRKGPLLGLSKKGL